MASVAAGVGPPGVRTAAAGEGGAAGRTDVVSFPFCGSVTSDSLVMRTFFSVRFRAVTPGGLAFPKPPERWGSGVAVGWGSTPARTAVVEKRGEGREPARGQGAVVPSRP